MCNGMMEVLNVKYKKKWGNNFGEVKAGIGLERVAPNTATELEINRLHHMLRKNAHFIAYLILGILVMNALRSSREYGYQSIALALLICALYAISDEIHQIYVPGRSGELRDVMIDSVGASVGIGVYVSLLNANKF